MIRREVTLVPDVAAVLPGVWVASQLFLRKLYDTYTTGRSSGLPFFLSPSRNRIQWLFDRTFVFIAFQHRNRKGAYSYGDSAGFTPDFPFNPAIAGTVCGCKYGRFELRRKIYLSTSKA
jgi:hypothetical protein